MPEVLRKTITVRSQTPDIDTETAVEILDHVAAYETGTPLDRRATDDESVVFADHDPETTEVFDEDATLVTATDEGGRVGVQFRASEDTLDACLDVLEHVLDETTLRTGDPPDSDHLVDVQVIADSPMEPYKVSPPEGMLFRTKRTPDGRTALRVVAQKPLELDESTAVLVEEVQRGLLLAEEV